MDSVHKRDTNGAFWFNPLLLGVALHFAWVYLLFYSIDAHDTFIPVLPFPASQAVFWGSGLFLGVTLALFSWRPEHVMEACEAPWMQTSVPVAVCLGTIATLLAVNGVIGGDFLMPTFVVASALTGLGSAVLACRWAQAVSQCRMGVVLLHGLPIVACVIAIVETASYLPPTVHEMLTAVLPALSALTLERARKGQARGTSNNVEAAPCSNRGLQPEHVGSADSKAGFFAPLYACIFILGGVPAYIAASPGTSPIAFDAVFCMAAAFGVLTLICVYIALFHKPDLPVAAALPLGVVVCVFVPSAALPGTSLLDAFLPVGYICLEALLFLLTLVCAKKTGASPVRTYAIGRIVYMTADILGYGVGTQVVLDAQTGVVVNIFVVLIGCVIILVTAMLLILTSSSGFFVRRGGADGTGGDNTKRNAQVEAESLHTAQSAIGQGEAFASRYGLTPREVEVLTCLLRGHSQQRIQDELSISKGTASFHIQNLYAKCGVHSRQELIDLHERQNDCIVRL